jgi:hypothetical protein
MRRPQQEFLDREIQVVFTSGTLIGTLEAVAEDGSLWVKQGRTPVWVPLAQVKYVTLAEPIRPERDSDEA